MRIKSARRPKKTWLEDIKKNIHKIKLQTINERSKIGGFSGVY